MGVSVAYEYVHGAASGWEVETKARDPSEPGSYRLPWAPWRGVHKLNSSALEEQPVFLTTEPSPPADCFIVALSYTGIYMRMAEPWQASTSHTRKEGSLFWLNLSRGGALEPWNILQTVFGSTRTKQKFIVFPSLLGKDTQSCS